MGIVITLSRQLGSGGSYMGADAATLLGFRYLDREILQHAAMEAGFPDEAMVEALAYQEQVPGLFLFLGAGDEKHKAPLHNGKFDFDERALLTGVEIYRRVLGLCE